jgi:hypothetical protein
VLTLDVRVRPRLFRNSLKRIGMALNGRLNIGRVGVVLPALVAVCMVISMDVGLDVELIKFPLRTTRYRTLLAS